MIMDMNEAFKELVEFCKGDLLALPLLQRKLEASPEGTIRANLDAKVNDDTTLLHYVCYNKRVTLDIVKYLVSLYPDAVELQTEYGWVPLHRACCNVSCPSNVVQYLVRIYPGALSVSWPYRGLPLHCLISRKTKEKINDQETSYYHLDLDLVKLLVTAYPDALTNQDNQCSNTPLLLACQREDVSMDLVRLLVDPDHRSVLRIRGRYGKKLPIETIFEQYHEKEWEMPFEVVTYFAESALDTLTPSTFHSVCRSWNVSLEAIQLIIDLKPDVSFLDQHGDINNLPLHSLCLNERKDNQDSFLLPIIKYVVEAYPEAVRARNNYGFLPLTYAVGSTLEITKVLVEEYPESVYLPSGDDGHLPFHTACRNGSIDTVKYLFERNPEAINTDKPALSIIFNYDRDVEAKMQFLIEKDPHSVKMKDPMTGNLPLHSACEQFTPNLSIIKNLFERYPDAVATRNHSGRFPLHAFLAIDRFMNNEFVNDQKATKALETVIFLVKQFPVSVRVADEEGMLPLHLASQNYHLAIVKYLSQEHPDGVKAESPIFGLPLHCASGSRNVGALPVVCYLVSLYSESCGIRNKLVGIPLECTICKEIFQFLLLLRYKDRGAIFYLHRVLEDEEILKPALLVKKFLDHFPGNLKEIDNHGRYPLHIAVSSSRASPSVVQELFDGHPSAVEHQDKQGCLPLHLFLRNSTSIDIEDSKLILKILLREYPNSLKVSDHTGSLPLHFSCRNGSSLSVLKTVLSSCPEALKCIDHNGCTPFHVACRHGLLSVDAIRHLVNFDCTSTQTIDNNLELPLHKACRGGHVEIVNLLLEEFAPASSIRNASASLPIHILCQNSGKANMSVIDTPAFIETIWRLLRAHPEAVNVN